MRARDGACGLALACAGAAWAQAGAEPAARPALPLWEAGVAAGAGYVPDYPGADRSSVRAAVLPVFVYRGPILRIDEQGIRGRVFRDSEWELDVTAAAAFNAKHNEAREGMPAIDYLAGVGPQLVYKGLRSSLGAPSLHFKLRALVSTDFERIDGRGYTLATELRLRRQGVAGTSAALTGSLQPTWASAQLQRYFYEVQPAYATPARPAYAARSGYLGTELALTLDHRIAPGLSWFATARWMSLHGAANTASPLLRDRGNASVGAGVVWTPWRSAAAAGD